ncbi:MAG: serine/threonine-protein kinase [bacterium]|nr:serine/threonine protein kinase [Myxococcales bacterium]MCB9543534.1 serine/threonine protein kinase [Myxococcales bacterium]MCB9553940.1 serine/threonine protein kinase [Myxococcales bacterium]
MAARLPRFIGPYSVEGRLGTGGMGIVLYARHRLLGREVAVKIRHRGENQDEHLLAERFRQGAILQAELDHPHVARVYDYLESPMFQAIVMEYLPGGSLEDKLRSVDGPLPIPMAIDIGIRSADAMAYAHRRTVVHRDIKPANLMMVDADDPGSVRITDFGVAKALERSPDLTVAGANVGTLWYMPPEQFNHEKPTPLADVYSLGATIYEMLTGQIPFEAPDTSEIFRRFLDGVPPPPILGRNPFVPPTVAAVVETALALKPEARIPSAAVLALLLRAVAEGEGITIEDTAGRRLLAQANAHEIKRILQGLGGTVGREVGQALSAFESRLLGGSAVTRVDSAPVPPHEPSEISSLSLSGSLEQGDPFEPSEHEVEHLVNRAGHRMPVLHADDEEDRTAVMDAPTMDDD